MRQPTHRERCRFCEIDGWDYRKTDHHRYEKTLPDGRVLSTKVSFGAGTLDDPKLWQRIWKEQLALPSEDEFWRVIETGEPANRESPTAVLADPETLPGWVVDHLYRDGMSDEEMNTLTEREAIDRVYEIFAREAEQGDQEGT